MRLRTAAVGTSCFILGASVFMAVGSLAATTLTTLRPGYNLHVTCRTTLTNMNVKANSETVHCARASTTTANAAAGATTTSTTPPTTTTTVPATTQPSSAETCVTSDSGGLPTYDDPTDINNSNGYNTNVQNNVWGDINIDNTEKLCGSGPSNWNVTVGIADGPDGGAVQSYPDVQQLYNDWSASSDGSTPVSGGPTGITSTFQTTDPPLSQGQWELGYDIWFNDYPNDIMVWEDTSTARLADNGATVDDPNVVIDGVSYTLVHYGSGSQPERMLIRNTDQTSGSENILADLRWLQANNYLPAGAGIEQVDFGWEICDTDGTTAGFAVNGYTLTRTPLQP